jgi:peptidoglycan/xylan/chitin deacetylase (PgdA/CDA1 family)
MIKKKLKLKKLLMVLGLATFGLSLGNAGFCQDPWHPKFKYAVVTFDDGLPPTAFNKILPMLFQNCDVDGNGTATDPASCITNDRVRNLDGTLVEFTYFTTNGMNEFFNNIDYWYSQGNEIANHTVTHGTGWGTQPGVKIFSKERWTQEITDNVKIIKNWTSIDPKTAVTGFRAPFLVINNDTFTGLDDALSLSSDGKVYYDSDIAYELKNTNKLLPPVKLENKMCGDWPYSPLPRRIDCDTLIPEDGFNNTLWELPIPAFLGCGGEKVGCSAMVLPDHLYLEKSFADVETLNNENVPLLISIHTAVITKQFQEWVRKMAANGELTFVRAREVINMYANPEHTEPSERVTEPILCEPTLAMGSEAASLCKAANSWASNVDDPTKPQCSVLCNNKNYGSNCEIRLGTPGNVPGGLGFNTCNKINNNCNPNTIPDDYRNGGYPWLGNPQGNSTPGNKCGYLPQITGGN